MKTKVIRDAAGAVINIGPWDYQMEPIMADDHDKPIYCKGEPIMADDLDKPIYVDGEPTGTFKQRVVAYEQILVGYGQKQVGERARNPLPDGAHESEADVVTGGDGGLYAAENYRGLRAGEYPPIGDQLDALFKAGLFPSDMATALQAVKEKFPKPLSGEE